MTDDHASCPFCDCSWINGWESWRKNGCVRCMRCGARGPYIPFEDDDEEELDRRARRAIRAWDSLNETIVVERHINRETFPAAMDEGIST